MTDAARTALRRPPILSAALFLVALPSMLAAPQVAAQTGPTVEYQADRIFRDERGERVRTTFYYSKQRQRLDFLAGTERRITIVDAVAKRIVILNPRRKTKQTLPYKAPAWDFGLSQPGATFTKVAPEQVGGVLAIKYRARGASADGQVYEGFAWLTAQRIVVRLDGTVRRGTQTQRFFMTTENLKTGELDPRLFLVPPDYDEAK